MLKIPACRLDISYKRLIISCKILLHICLVVLLTSSLPTVAHAQGIRDARIINNASGVTSARLSLRNSRVRKVKYSKLSTQTAFRISVGKRVQRLVVSFRSTSEIFVYDLSELQTRVILVPWTPRVGREIVKVRATFRKSGKQQRKKFRLRIAGGGSLLSEGKPGTVSSSIANTEPPAARGYSIRNSTVYRSGVKVFPVGIYYVSHFAADQLQRMEDITNIAAAGFKYIHTPIDLNDKDFLDRCAELGVSVALEFNDSETALLTKFGTHPALSILGTFDDVDARDDGEARFSPSFVEQQSAALQSRAPEKITYVSAGTADNFSDYVGRTNTLAVQTYPVPSEPISSTYNFLTKVKAVVENYPNQAFLANLQSFGWNGQSRVPTPLELRNMTYQSLLAGVRGIFFYTYFDEVMNMREHPELWEEMQSTVSELKELSPMLLDGSYVALDSGKTEVLAGRWSYQGSDYIVVVNMRNSSQTISISLPSAERVLNLFEDRLAELSIVNGSLSGRMSKQSVQVFLVQP